MGGEDGAAAVRAPLDHLPEEALARGVHARRGLVEKDELGAANMCLNLRRREKIEEKKQHESILKEFESKCNRLDIMNVQQNETLQKSIRLEREIFAPLATDLKASRESKSTPPPKEMLLELYKLRTLAWEQALKKT